MMTNGARQAVVLFSLACAVACPPPVKRTPPPATASAEEVAIAGASVLIGAGDVATCPSNGDESTARIVDSVLKADSVAKVDDAAISIGDNVYPNGAVQDFHDCFTPSWGNPNLRVMKKLRPVPGNHEYDTPGASPYYQYFGDRAGPAGKGYYAYDLGEWRIYGLNSEIAVDSRFTPDDRKAQEDWLRDDLQKNKKACVLAYWHHPRFSSSYHGSDARLYNLMAILDSAGADVVFTGHDHTYERFLPQTASGVRDTMGITQFVIGTGGADLRGFRTPAPNSAARVEGHYGVLKMTLGKSAYQYVFLDTNGLIWDPGHQNCH